MSRLHAAVALIAAVWLLVVSTDGGPAQAPTITPHHPHVTATSHDAQAAVIAEHPHIGRGLAPTPREVFTAALPPRAATTLIAMGLITALVAATALLTRVVPPVMRGPPPQPSFLAGRQLITRFCIARR